MRVPSISLPWDAALKAGPSPTGRYLSHLPLPTDGSASLLLPPRPAPARQAPYLVPVELRDWGQPALSSTATVTVSVCRCRPDGSLASCWPEAQLSPTGLSTGALLAIVTCMGTLLGESVLQWDVMWYLGLFPGEGESRSIGHE